MTAASGFVYFGARVTALFVASLALGDRSRLAVAGLILAALFVWQLGRLPELSDGRRLWRNSADPAFQGDGIRWTLCLLLPNVLLWRAPDGCPFTFDMLVLDRWQRDAYRAEWQAAQEEQARLGRPLERWETIEREERGG